MTKIRLNKANKTAAMPGYVKFIEVSIPPRSGPIINPKPKAAPIIPNVFARFSGVEISANTAAALAAVPPLPPSIILAKNSKTIIKGVTPLLVDTFIPNR